MNMPAIENKWTVGNGTVETVYSARSDNRWQQGGWLRSPVARPEESEWSI